MRTDGDTVTSPSGIARGLIRNASRATLATRMRETDGEPYASLVLSACGHDASPILLISGLAEHTRNILADPRVSLLYDGTVEYPDPLTGPRVSVQGVATITDDPTLRARYLTRHPDAAAYAGFGDFAFYSVAVERAHLVAGFGRIDWIPAADLLFDTTPAAALAVREADVVTHMNEDHADAIDLYATRLLGRTGSGWRMTGIDPEGIDLTNDGETARLGFDTPVYDADAARQALVALVKAARQIATHN
jgi:putative heme iron utilization protein